MPSLSQVLAAGFPAALAERVLALFADDDAWPASIPTKVYRWAFEVPVTVAGEPIVLPGRVYLLERAIDDPLVHAVFCRHHDGHIRERHLAPLMRLPEPWVAPYVIALLGEYVLPIIVAILRDLTPAMLTVLGVFVRQNPVLWVRIRSRITSYWDAYYSNTYPRRARRFPGHLLAKDYPGYQLAKLIEAARPTSS